MTASAADNWPEQADEPAVCVEGKIDPRLEDAYWQSVYWSQPYYRSELDYEDYAPAYCAGYIGHAQYGGRFEDAEKSLCANWLRIKGDSRLTLEEAVQAMRAAWRHAEQGPVAVEDEEDDTAVADLPVLQAQRRAPQPAYAAA